MDIREQLERAIAAMESQRGTLGDAVVDAALTAFREKLDALDSQGEGTSSSIDQPWPVTLLIAEVLGLGDGAETSNHYQTSEAGSEIWQRLDGVITRLGGMIDRHIGDGVIAIFGAQTTHPGDAEQAVRASLAMRDEVQQYRAGANQTNIRFRAAINSGAVLLNKAGVKHENIVLSDTAKLTSRLQKVAEPGDILISQTTYRAVRGIFDTQTLDLLKGELLVAYRVIGIRPRVLRVFARQPGTVAPLVGRDVELPQIQAAFTTVKAESRVYALTLSGEAGSGKSRLANEFLNWLDTNRQPFILMRGRGDWQMNRLPYALLRELLFFRLKILDGDPAEVVREKLLHGVETWLGPEGVETAHWIGHLVGCDFNQSPFLNGRLDDLRRARQLSFQALNRFIAAIAQQTPLIVLADDLQWADDGSLDWLDSIARSEMEGPILLLGLTRPLLFERRPSWGERWARHTRINLSPLPQSQAATLAGQLLRTALNHSTHATYSAPTRPRKPGQTGPLVDPLDVVIVEPVQKIIERANGNPFFIEELAQAFLEDAIFVPSSGESGGAAWKVDAARLESGSLPGSLIEVLQARLEDMPDSEREVLLRAAVVGPVFWESAVYGLLESAADSGEDSLLRVLDLPGVLHALQEHGLIYKRESSAFEHTDEYAFKNALLYEVAYESQLVRCRRQDHARVAVWLAAQSGERVEAYSAVIAGHYERAEERLLAADWYGLAALQARRASAPEAALRFFTRALELLPDEPAHFPQRVQLYKGIWDVQWWQARYADALATAQALLANAEARGDQVVQSSAWNRIAAIQNRQSDYQSALRSVQRAERLARSGGAAREVVLALFNRGVTLYRMGDAAAALEAGERALAFNQTLFGQGGESGLDTDAASGLGMEPVAIQTAQENLERARELVREEARVSGMADEAAREAARETARILNLLAMINQRAGRYAQAENDYRQVLALHRERGDRASVLATLNSLGVLAHQQGDFHVALSYFQESYNLAKAMGFQELSLVCLNNLAGAQVEMEEYTLAETGLREVLRRADSNTGFLLTEVYYSLTLACLGQDRCSEALTAGLRALEVARQAHLNQHIGRAWRVLGRISAALGPQAEGAPVPVIVDGKECSTHACYAASLQIFVEMGMASEQARTARDLASYELEQGDRREGIRLWQEARDLFARLGLRMEVERMDRLAEQRT
jgi:predicted ATPase/class 3 adenylate cyclase